MFIFSKSIVDNVYFNILVWYLKYLLYSFSFQLETETHVLANPCSRTCRMRRTARSTIYVWDPRKRQRNVQRDISRQTFPGTVLCRTPSLSVEEREDRYTPVLENTISEIQMFLTYA